MDLKKAKILLEKINALHKSMSADASNVASIEKDLMRSYVQQYYEIFLDDMPQTPMAVEAPAAVEIIKSSSSAKTTQKASPPKLEVTEPAPRPETPAPTPRKAYTPPRIIDLPDSLKDITEAQPTPPPPAPKPKPKPAQAQIAPKTAAPEVGEDLAELFEMPKAKELSDKLSTLPITDLKKAMGLNEKIFTINELFGGDQAAFDTAIATMNRLDNFDQAKAYLIENAAIQYKWTSRNRKKKARTFIKLVMRRFS